MAKEKLRINASNMFCEYVMELARQAEKDFDNHSPALKRIVISSQIDNAASKLKLYAAKVLCK